MPSMRWAPTALAYAYTTTEIARSVSSPTATATAPATGPGSSGSLVSPAGAGMTAAATMYAYDPMTATSGMLAGGNRPTGATACRSHLPNDSHVVTASVATNDHGAVSTRCSCADGRMSRCRSMIGRYGTYRWVDVRDHSAATAKPASTAPAAPRRSSRVAPRRGAR